ncbi:Protein T23B5.4 a [Aphelenchoides avenae]|nr:Protein T23B5.4 a [Aphelenchus avenae]
MLCSLRPSSTAIQHLRQASGIAPTVKKRLKDYAFPEIRREDCDQRFITGWGPGGSRVAAQQNAVQVKHLPTGVVVKVHESRLQLKNIEIAYERLKLTVDRHLNGESCYEAQLKRLQREHEERTNRKLAKKRELKQRLATDAHTEDGSSSVPQTEDTMKQER